MEEVALLAASPRRAEPKPHLWPFIFLACIVLAVAVALLGDSSQGSVTLATPTPDRAEKTYLVTYRYGVFSPTNLRIHAGDTVRWRNDDTTPVSITAQLVPGQRAPLFGSGKLASGEEFIYDFAVSGVFGYENADVPRESGVIIVR
jgi:plastocyanin